MSEVRDDADLPRDAWLREALRHAPDADAAPPPKLNETILRMGRAAVAPREERKTAAAPHSALPPPSGTVAGGGALASLWAWLTRPPVAAGFAVVFLSTVVGVMWMGRPIDEALPPREETVATAPPPAPMAADAPAERTREAAQMPEAAKRAAQAPAAAAPAPVPPAAPADTPRAAPPAAPPVAAATPPSPPPAAANDMAAREVASAERREAPAARMAAAAPAPAQATAAVAPASAIETPSLSNLRFEIRRKPDTWSWQRDEGESRPMDDAMQDWIAQADRSARPAWQHGAAAAGASVTTTLRFTRDGVVRAVLRIGPTGLQLTRGGKTESVELSRGQLAALQASLDALGP